MDLLTIESTDDDPVVKSSMKGFAPVPARTAQASETRGNRAGSVVTPKPMLLHTNSSTSNNLTATSTNASDKNMITNTVINSDSKEENILYPFRIKHLGKETFTLYTVSSQNRKDWCEKIIEAKTKHASSLFAQNAEPFRVRVLADTAFALDAYNSGVKSILIKGAPLHRALEDVENQYLHAGRSNPVCRARVNCSTSFSLPTGKQMIAVGTDYGVYITEAGNVRGWKKVRDLPSVGNAWIAMSY